MNRHVEIGHRSVTFRHIVVGERSVTYLHKRNKDNESWNYVNKFEWKEPISPNEHGVETWVLIGVFDVVTHDLWTCCFHPLRNMVDFMLLSDIYCFLFWVGRWYLLSTCALYWPLLVFIFLIICGVQQTWRRLQLNRNSSQSSLHRISGWANASSLDWIFLFMSWSLELPTWTSFLLVLAY